LHSLCISQTVCAWDWMGLVGGCHWDTGTVWIQNGGLIAHLFICSVIHSFIIPGIHKCVTETIGCGTRHKYKNIHNIHSVKYYKHL
jgi:hypothetical protein